MDNEVKEYSIPESKLYAVVELAVDSISDEDETEPKIFACIAASTWLSNVTRAILEDIIKYHGDLVWPDNEAELQPFLQKPHSKPPNHWAIHHRVRILKFCDTLGQAKLVCTQATNKSDFTDSDVSSNIRRKRHRKQVNRLAYSNECSDSDSSDDNAHAPHIKGLSITSDTTGGKVKSSKTYKRVRIHESPSAEHETNENEPSPPAITRVNVSSELNSSSSQRFSMTLSPSVRRNLKFHSASKTKTNTPLNTSQLSQDPSSSEPRSTLAEVQLEISEKSSSQKPLSQQKPSSSSFTTPLSSPRGFPITMSPRRNSIAALGVSNRIFTREMQELRSRCDKLSIIVHKIYNCVCPILETSQENAGCGLPKLPNSSFEEIDAWETFLKDHDNALHVVRLLSDRCSASCLRDSVNNMLRFILSNKLACSFNYKGKNKSQATMNKVAFESSKSCTVILAALNAFKATVVKSGGILHFSIAPADVGIAIGKWLKDAPKRFLLDLKCDKAVAPCVTKVPPEMFLTPPEDFKFIS